MFDMFWRLLKYLWISLFKYEIFKVDQLLKYFTGKQFKVCPMYSVIYNWSLTKIVHFGPKIGKITVYKQKPFNMCAVGLSPTHLLKLKISLHVNVVCPWIVWDFGCMNCWLHLYIYIYIHIFDIWQETEIRRKISL